MTIERGLFDHTGALPPVTKLSIELPPEYREKPELGAVAPYSDGGVDQQVLADIQSAVMREYGGTARRLLNAFRQDVGLGDLSVNGRKAMLGEGVGMSYVSQFGNEAIRIHVSQEAVRKLVGQASDRCMLVLYGDRQLAYVSMKELDNGFPAVGKWKRETRTQSYWGVPDWWITGFNFTDIGFFFDVTQMKLGTNFHVVSTTMKIANGVINSNIRDMAESEFDFKIFVSNAKKTIHESVSPTLSISTGRINGSGSTVYDYSGNIYSVDSSGTISLTYDRTVDDLDTFKYPTYVSSNGERTGGIVWSNDTMNVSGGGDFWFTAGQKTLFNSTPPIEDTSGGSILNNIMWGSLWSSNSGPGDAVTIDYAYPTIVAHAPEYGSFYFKWYILNDSRMVSLKYPMYSNNGTIDIITPTNVEYTISVSQSVTLDGFGYPDLLSQTTSLSVPFFGFDASIDISGDFPFPAGSFQNGIISYASSYFPGYNNKLWGYMKSGNFSNDTFTNKLSTPYTDTYTDSNIERSVVEMWHCSNGKHCLQAFYTRLGNMQDAPGDRTAWLNGQNVTTALGAVAGGIDNIRAVLFDIKLDDIKKLK